MSEPEVPPVRRFDFTTTRADALAWERLPVERTGWRLVAFYLWLATAGLWIVLAEEAFGLVAWSLPHLVVIAAAVGFNLGVVRLIEVAAVRRRAARRRPEPVAVHVEDHGGHLVHWEGAAARPATARIVALDRVRQIVVTEDRLMVDVPPEVLILPLAVFADVADMRATAAAWDARAEAAVP